MINLVVEHIGGEVLPKVFDCLARGGAVVTCGATAGREVTLNLWPFFVKQHRLIGSYGRNRADIQKTLEAIRKNLTELKSAGQRLIKAIPAKPEPPSSDVADLLDPVKRKQFDKDVADFGQGVRNLLESLGNYIKNGEDVLKRTDGDLAKVEKNLNMKGAKWTAMRQISNAKRLEDIQYIKLKEIEALSSVVSDVKTLYKAYERF